MLIRRATAEDRAAIAAMLVPVIRDGTTYALDRTMTDDAALAYWFAPAHDVFVTEDGGAVVGTCYCRANQAGGGSHVANCGYVTHPDATGRGVARAMAIHSFDHARAAGFRAMQYNFVVATNTRALALWRSLGFAEVGRLPGAFDHPVLGEVDALVLYRRL